jgi:glycosyltransferase involved in cell wall biosynthesis
LKAVISSGFGKLHFHETARALASAGVEVQFLTGWVPGKNQTATADFLGNLLGEKDLAKRLASRQIDIPGAHVTSIAWPEVAGTLIGLAQRAKLLQRDLAYGLEFRVAAFGSRKHLKNADALLVRSGAGQSGAIKTARKNGMGVVTDHSIAHPAYIHEVLREEFERCGLDVGYDPKTDIWKLVLRDCEDADLLLVNSDFVKETFVERGYSPAKIRVAYLGVRELFYRLKQDYSIAGQVKILFTGNFDVRKGVRVLLEAIRQCRRGGLDVRLHLIGNLGNGQPHLRSSDQDFFVHAPYVPQVELLSSFSRTDLFVLPTFAEGSSRSAMEAAAAGMPVITTKSCGLPLEHEKSAFYVPVGDVDALANAIARLSADENLRESMGRNAAQTLAENYTWQHYGQRVAETLREIVQH